MDSSLRELAPESVLTRSDVDFVLKKLLPHQELPSDGKDQIILSDLSLATLSLSRILDYEARIRDKQVNLSTHRLNYVIRWILCLVTVRMKKVQLDSLEKKVPVIDENGNEIEQRTLQYQIPHEGSMEALSDPQLYEWVLELEEKLKKEANEKGKNHIPISFPSVDWKYPFGGIQPHYAALEDQLRRGRDFGWEDPVFIRFECRKRHGVWSRCFPPSYLEFRKEIVRQLYPHHRRALRKNIWSLLVSEKMPGFRSELEAARRKPRVVRSEEELKFLTPEEIFELEMEEERAEIESAKRVALVMGRNFTEAAYRVFLENPFFRESATTFVKENRICWTKQWPGPHTDLEKRSRDWANALIYMQNEQVFLNFLDLAFELEPVVP